MARRDEQGRLYLPLKLGKTGSLTPKKEQALKDLSRRLFKHAPYVHIWSGTFVVYHVAFLPDQAELTDHTKCPIPSGFYEKENKRAIALSVVWRKRLYPIGTIRARDFIRNVPEFATKTSDEKQIRLGWFYPWNEHPYYSDNVFDGHCATEPKQTKFHKKELEQRFGGYLTGLFLRVAQGEVVEELGQISYNDQCILLRLLAHAVLYSAKPQAVPWFIDAVGRWTIRICMAHLEEDRAICREELVERGFDAQDNMRELLSEQRERSLVYPDAVRTVLEMICRTLEEVIPDEAT